VAEVSADAALQAGQWRHGLRYLRHRADLQPQDVPILPASQASTTGTSTAAREDG
jgi:hypothetical protein